jgi:hypothetical protein
VGDPTFIDADFCVNKGLIVDFEKSTVRGIEESGVYLVAIIALMVFFNLTSFFVSFMVYKEYGFTLYRSQGADIRKKRMLGHYHALILLLKLNIYFSAGFIIQIVASAVFAERLRNPSSSTSLIELLFGVGIGMSIVFFFIYFMGHKGVKRGNSRMMYSFIFLIFINTIGVCVGLWYAYSHGLSASKIWLTLFGVIDTGLNLATIWYAVKCTMDFKHESIKELIEPVSTEMESMRRESERQPRRSNVLD